MLRCCPIIALCLTSSLQFLVAAPSPEIRLEEGVLAFEGRNDLNHAKAIFREILTMENLPARTGAEALWHMSEVYRRQGSDEACLLVLRKLGQLYPSAPPYTTAAAELAVTLSRELGADITVPSDADLLTSQDLVRIVCAALQLNDKQEAALALINLRELNEALLFELAIPIPDESSENAKERATVSDDFRDYLAWVDQVAAALKDKPAKELLDLTKLPIVAHMASREDMDQADLNERLYRVRDAITVALGAADGPAVTTAVKQLQEFLQTLTEAPRDLGMVMAMQGELTALKLINSLVQEQKFSEALHAWREARLTFLNSGVAGQGMILQDGEAIPETLWPRVIAALMFVEEALYSVNTEENSKHANTALLEAISRLQKLATESPEAACKQRLNQIASRLHEAISSIKSKETGRAKDLMRTEIYVTP
jgi:hypothetical protein